MKSEVGIIRTENACCARMPLMPHKGWRRKFEDPIELPDGGKLRPLSSSRFPGRRDFSLRT